MDTHTYGVRFVAMRVIQAPGIVVRQATDVMMESQVASELNSMTQATRDDELDRTHVNIGNAPHELVRRTEIRRTAIHQVAENAGHNNNNVAEDIHQWAEQRGYHLMQNLQELDKGIPRVR